MADTAARRALVAPAAITALLAFSIGWGVLWLVESGIAWMWVDTERPTWFVIAVPLAAAVAVYLVRRFLGDDGHEPLRGIQVNRLTPRQFVDVILAIVLSLLGGLVLGPEVALVSTGAVIGTVVAGRKWADATDRLATVGAFAAILALFAGPMLSGSMTNPSTQDTSIWAGLAAALAAAVLATVAVQAARALAWGLQRWSGQGPTLWAMVLAALVVGGGAVLLHAATGADIAYVVTSSEGQVRDLAGETSLALVVGVLAVKSVAYAASLGSGFRGGPFFPAMFVGAAAGMVLSLALPDVAPMPTAIIAGIVAATVATAKMPWRIALILGAAVGFIFGSWAMIPAAVVAAAVARAIPRFGDRLAA